MVILGFVDTFDIPECISECYFILLATSSFSWLTWTLFVVLDVLYLLVYNFVVELVLKFSSYLECRSFPPCIPLYYLPMLDYLSFPILSRLLVLLSYSKLQNMFEICLTSIQHQIPAVIWPYLCPKLCQ